ncbi:hypothetical protein LCGC14_0964840, partial [marine sediment metagenome]
YGVEHLAFAEEGGQCNLCLAQKTRREERKQPGIVMV